MAVGRRERGVEELYNATEVIGEPKITSVLRGSFRMQGPVEETEEDIEKNMLPSQSEKRLGKRSMRRKVRTRVESGTCNVCSTPCSSCMHLKLACMGSKGNGFSDETFHETATSQNSINEDDLFPFKNRAYDSLQHTTSEASNLLSVNSSHDSLSENVESKASINCTDMVDASVESEMLPKLSFGGTVVVDQLFPEPQSILDQITPSNKNEYPKVLEGHDDSISCVSRANDASITVIHHNRNVDRKNLSCSSALVGSLGSEGTEKAPISPESELLETPSNDAYAGNSSLNVHSRCLSTSNGTQLEEDRKLGTSMVSSQLAEGTGKALILPKSELLGTPSNDAYAGSSSQKVQSRCLSSTADGRDFEEDTKFDSSKVSSQLLEGTGKALIFPKAELLEIPSNDVYAGSSSLKVQSRCLSSTTNGTQLEEDTKFDTSKVSSKVCTKVEEGTKKDRGDRMNEGFKCANQVEANEKSNESVELTDMREPGLQSVSGDESDESEIEEHDVKVCDICGDAGREDLLAICSKCSDGAEHTYCMREMLQKVPEGDWLCEECKLAEETENQKQGSDSEGKRMNKASAHSSGKRHVETMEVASASKRQAIETTFGSPKSSSPSRPAALLRDSSFKGLDKGKVNPAQQTSFVNHSSIDTPETARSSIVPRIQTPKGTLLKSNSFNTFSKSKVKLVDEVPQKQKGSRENRSLDIKEGTARMISKSMSFRSVSSVRSNATDSKVKMLSSKFSQAQDIKALKQVKEQGAFESKSSSKLGRPMGVSVTNSSNISVPKVSQKLTPRGDSVMVSTTSNNKESNASQSDGKLGSLSRSTSSIARKGAEIPVTSVRSLPANGISSAFVEQKLNQVSPKDEPSSSSSGTAERPYHNMDENLQDGLSRSRESSNQSEKTRESSVSRSRPAITAGPKNITCQKCKEIGHATDCCTVVSPRASVVDTSAARTVREDMSKGSKLKAAIEAAMLKKPGIFKKKKESDQSDGLSSLNVDVTFEIAPHDQFSVSNKMRNMISDEGTEEGQANIGICSSENYKEANINNEKQLNVHSTDAVSPFKAMVLDSTIPSLGKPIHALGATPLFSKMLIIPQHEYIWQGAFEVCRGGKLLNLYGGIQAHLSTCASPKVLEVANQFPQKITMDEVPRLSMWPRQFHDNGSKEDNIALYFFAKDLESYEKSYKNLLDNMIKRDLALKGYFDGVEFLIFPSTQLPENSQRWNTLFFLWGVFRGNRSSCSDSFNKLVIPGSNVVPWDMNSPDKPLTSLNGDLDNKASQTNSEEQDGRLDSNSLSTNAASSASFCSETRCTSPSKEAATLPECRVDTEHKPSTQATGISTGSKSREETQSHVDASCVRENSSSFKVFQVGDKGEDVRESVVEEKMVDRMDTHRDEVKVERNLNENSLMMDAEASSGRDLNKGLDWQSNSRKRSYLDLSETAPRTSSSTGQKMPWDIVDGESIKKLKTGFCELYGCSSAREGNSLSDGFASQICDLGSSSSIEERSCDKAADEKVILEDIGTTERYFFPVDSRRVKDFRLGDNSMPWKEYSSNDEDEFHDEVPNLELALGAEAKTPNKGILPFFVGMVEKNNSQKKTPDNVTDKEEEDGVSASLSLSLSFPFPDEEQTVKPVSKTEQLLPERHNVNTSLLLFGGFSDK